MQEKATKFFKNLVDVATNRHIVKNLARSTRTFLSEYRNTVAV